MYLKIAKLKIYIRSFELVAIIIYFKHKILYRGVTTRGILRLYDRGIVEEFRGIL